MPKNTNENSYNHFELLMERIKLREMSLKINAAKTKETILEYYIKHYNRLPAKDHEGPIEPDIKLPIKHGFKLAAINAKLIS